MSKSMHDEHGAIQPDQQKDPYKAKSFSETNSAFFTTKKHLIVTY